MRIASQEINGYKNNTKEQFEQFNNKSSKSA